ncbi:MAG: ABC transporter ATP-binding protein [Chitinophagaceae bacterium]|nr:ABC transporter ATP-binding protein [Chitinophagaceae bacterium]
MELLRLDNVSARIQQNTVLEGISFTLEAGRRLAIAGQTGSGKTTLLKLIGGLAAVHHGTVLFNGQRVLGPEEKLLPGHPAIGYLSQHFELRNNYRVEEELEAKNQLPDIQAQHIYEVCRISHLLKRKTDQLSGGERQRIVLARLLTTNPVLLLLDEPFSNLDPAHRNVMFDVINDIGQKLGVTCILVSHDAADTLPWADTIIVLKDGKMVQQATPEEVYLHPADEYVAALFGEYNLVDDLVQGRRLLVRPEHLVLCEGEGNCMEGRVQQVLYYGSYSIAVIVCSGQQLKMRVREGGLKPGEDVRIKVVEQKAHVI